METAATNNSMGALFDNVRLVANALLIAENSSNGSVVGTVLGQDVDTGDTRTYSLVDSAGGRFAVNSSTGQVTVANASLLDFEAVSSHNITVRVTDTAGATFDKVMTVQVTNVNDPPVLSGIESTTLYYTEGTEIAISANLALSDVDSANIASATIQITGNFRSIEDELVVYGLHGGQTKTWDANTGTLTITGSQTLARYQTILRTVSYWNFSDSPDLATRTVTFTINDGNANSNSVARAISVASVNDAPIAVTDTATALEAGGQSNGTAGTNPTGNVLTNDTDVDAGDNKTVTGVSAGVPALAGGPVGEHVAGTYGSINIAANGAYTYTVDNSNAAVQSLRTTANTLQDVFTYTMRDTAGLTSTTQVTVTIQGANDAPHDLAGTLTVAENAANGTSVGTITRSDVDSGDGATYSLVDDAGGRFAINSSTGVVTVANSSLLDRETAASHNITVRVTDTAGATYDEVFTVAITDVDEFDVGAVTDNNAASNNVNENATVGTVVGITAAASDADATTNTITYTLDDSAGGRFAVNSSTGFVTVAGAIDYETNTSHSITVRATSADGSFSTQVFTIQVNDVNEGSVGPVTDANTSANLVLENSANGTQVGLTGLATDPDGSDTVSYSVDDSAGGRFAINSSTGIVTVAGGIDREAAGSYNITIRATSSDTSFSTQSFTITIGDIDEFDVGAITDSNATANSIAENSANGTVVGITAQATDADSTNNNITYSLNDDAGGRFTIISSTGIITVANSALLDFESAASHTIIVQATSSDGSQTSSAFTVSLLPVNERPVAQGDRFQTDYASAIPINLATLLANDIDPDGDTLHVTILGAPSKGVLVAVDPRTLIYKPEPNYVGNVTLIYSVSDGSLSSEPQTIEIIVTPPATTAIAPPVDRENQSATVAEKVISVNESNVAETRSNPAEVKEPNPIAKQYGSTETPQLSGDLPLESPSFARSKTMKELYANSYSETFHLDAIAGFDTRLPQEQSLRRLQLEFSTPTVLEPGQPAFMRFIQSEERESLERQKQEFFFRTATPIAVGTAIGAGISLHILASAQIGTSLLSHSGLFLPLDPLMVLEGTSKVKKSNEREDILFEAASLKNHGDKQ